MKANKGQECLIDEVVNYVCFLRKFFTLRQSGQDEELLKSDGATTYTISLNMFYNICTLS